MTRSALVRPVLISSNNDIRDGALFVALSRACPGLRIILPSGPNLADWPPDVEIHAIDTLGRNWTQQWMRGLTSAIEDYNPDLIHIHNEPWAVTTQRLIRGRRPVVIHAAESVLADAPLIYRVRRVGIKSSLKRAAGYVNWGVTGLSAAQHAGLPPSTPRAVIPASPPDPESFPRLPARQSDGQLRVLFVGRLVPLKGVDDLLRAVALSSAPDRLTVTVCGSGPEEQRLRGLASSLGVHAEFLGALDAPGVHRALGDSDVLVSPSRDTRTGIEQWGRSVVEAMMSGRAVLVSDSGEQPHLVDNDNWVFPQNDPVSLAHHLNAFLAVPALTVTRADEAFERSRRFAPEALASELIAMWSRALGRWQSLHRV